MIAGDCDCCAETYKDQSFFACATFSDCVFKACKTCLEVCAVPEDPAEEQAMAVLDAAPVPAAVPAVVAQAPLDLSKVTQCRACSQALVPYGPQVSSPHRVLRILT